MKNGLQLGWIADKLGYLRERRCCHRNLSLPLEALGRAQSEKNRSSLNYLEVSEGFFLAISQRIVFYIWMGSES